MSLSILLYLLIAAITAANFVLLLLSTAVPSTAAVCPNSWQLDLPFGSLVQVLVVLPLLHFELLDPT